MRTCCLAQLQGGAVCNMISVGGAREVMWRGCRVSELWVQEQPLLLA